MPVLLTEAGEQLNTQTAFDILTEDHIRVMTNFLVGWYFTKQEDWQDVVDWAEGRTDDLFV